MTTAATAVVGGMIFLNNLTSTTKHKTVHAHMAGHTDDAAGIPFMLYCGAKFETNSAINAIKLQASAGNLTGRVILAGVI